MLLMTSSRMTFCRNALMTEILIRPDTLNQLMSHKMKGKISTCILNYMMAERQDVC